MRYILCVKGPNGTTGAWRNGNASDFDEDLFIQEHTDSIKESEDCEIETHSALLAFSSSFLLESKYGCSGGSGGMANAPDICCFFLPI